MKPKRSLQKIPEFFSTGAESLDLLDLFSVRVRLGGIAKLGIDVGTYSQDLNAVDIETMCMGQVIEGASKVFLCCAERRPCPPMQIGARINRYCGSSVVNRFVVLTLLNQQHSTKYVAHSAVWH